jgi:hypothetical protein
MIQTATAVGDAQLGRAQPRVARRKASGMPGRHGNQSRILVYVHNRTCLGQHNTPHVVDITTKLWFELLGPLFHPACGGGGGGGGDDGGGGGGGGGEAWAAQRKQQGRHMGNVQQEQQAARQR